METDSTRTINDLIEKIVESPGKYNADMIISLALALTRSKSGKTRLRVENAREKVIATNRLSSIQFSNTEIKMTRTLIEYLHKYVVTKHYKTYVLKHYNRITTLTYRKSCKWQMTNQSIDYFPIQNPTNL